MLWCLFLQSPVEILHRMQKDSGVSLVFLCQDLLAQTWAPGASQCLRIFLQP